MRGRYVYLDNASEEILDHHDRFLAAGHGTTSVDDPQQPVGWRDHCRRSWQWKVCSEFRSGWVML